MTAGLTVSNKQRRLKVDLVEFENVFELLRQGTFQNLQKAPPSHLLQSDLAKLAAAGSLSVVLVSDLEIKRLNKRWMGKDRATDVLSFPLQLEPPPVAAIPWDVGEIVISVERASAQAEELGHSFRREMAFLFVHGLLHVLGFDHMNPEDEADMFGRQKLILDETGFKRQ